MAYNGIVWTTRGELDASAHNIETDDGKQAVWQALANLNPTQCAANQAAAGCFDKIIGFTPARANTYPEGTNQGYTYGSPANIVVASDEDAAATVAHELAHNFGIGDAYDGGSFACDVNPTPDVFSGTSFTTSEPVKCTAGRVPLPDVSGTLVPAAHHPYEVGGRGALPDVAEFMGSGGRSSGPPRTPTTGSSTRWRRPGPPQPPGRLSNASHLRRVAHSSDTWSFQGSLPGTRRVQPTWILIRGARSSTTTPRWCPTRRVR